MTFFNVGLSEFKLNFVALVNLFELCLLLEPQLSVQAVDFSISLGDAFLEPFDLTAVVFCLLGLDVCHILTVLYFSASPPFCELYESLYATNGADYCY